MRHDTVIVISYCCIFLFICLQGVSLLYLLARYPYEAIRVVTADGYVLLLERIPRYVSFILVCVFLSSSPWYLC